MSVATQALLDTSVVIALGRGEPLALPDPPAEATISVVTLCGLHRGVLAAPPDEQAARLAVLAYTERTFKALAVDERVASEYGRISQATAGTGRDVRRHLADLLIAATAAAHGLLLLTRDRQLDATPGLETVLV